MSQSSKNFILQYKNQTISNVPKDEYYIIVANQELFCVGPYTGFSERLF